jgi:broad specificity phosphatase PhoE
MLLLVRHATPAYEESVAPELWPLSPDGQQAAREITLPDGAYCVASEELKAVQTLELAAPGTPVVRDARFNEVQRTGEPWEGTYRQLRYEYVTGVDHPGWEARDEVVARFTAAIRDHRTAAGERPLVVGTHGMVMTIWLTATEHLATPGTFWQALKLPHVLPVPL